MFRPLVLALALFVGTGLLAADRPLVSGPSAGQPIPAFNPLSITGPDAGKRTCLVCQHKANPGVLVFARTSSPQLTKLAKALDATVAAHADRKLAGFVILLTDDPAAGAKLKALADAEKLKAVVLATEPAAGPKGYSLHPDADLTVVVYVQRKTVKSFAFPPGGLTDADVEAVRAAVP